ncbi:ABC-F family ATP-binding cassette domain-containing protein [Paenarthrobacter sp. Z7-10]|uniref:ABC-F family ATP-binding cassette domain-containing protein n=1 Tax=Paenarthrobacter sp. Z7-10 TaxID=2787635 RepID=UPI0022A9902D|nr:ABC-F family ATP-binding cassette domain-containing protein [Paenarthrobacter sp. Z7-10]MCZ2401757.1 ABC-F family ATP-binding cassette domain-containing protein [Paenarthrobacter sp. Z7-10]
MPTSNTSRPGTARSNAVDSNAVHAHTVHAHTVHSNDWTVADSDTHIGLSEVSHSYGDRLLLDRITVNVAAGERAAIVGENGAGKSTLLRLMAGLEAPDGGSVTVRADIGYLAQSLDSAPGATVRDAIDTALSGIRALEQQLRALEGTMAAATAEELELYGSLLGEFELREGYGADARVDAAMDHLSLAGIGRDRGLSSLSGGERERLALACLLADPPAILLLDEPTNHLDGGAVDWLESRLSAHRGTVVAISHDRTFLTRVASVIIEVDGDRREVRRYGNGYRGYLQEKAAERSRWEQEYSQWLDAMAAERRQADTVADRMGYGRRRDGDKMSFGFKTGSWEQAAASKIRNAQERLRRLQANPVDRPPEPLQLAVQLGDGVLSGEVLAARGISVAGRMEVPELRVPAGAKLLITGPNGAGKTTLLDVLAGVRAPDTGTVDRRGRLGYLPQELGSPKHPGRRLLPAFAAGLSGDIDVHGDRLLRLGLFRTADFYIPVGSLSAGQYRRLALARLLVGHYDVILFDEPTNHLAPVLVGELEEVFAAYRGTLVLVSHDRALRRWFSRLEVGLELKMERGCLPPGPLGVC